MIGKKFLRAIMWLREEMIWENFILQGYIMVWADDIGFGMMQFPLLHERKLSKLDSQSR